MTIYEVSHAPATPHQWPIPTGGLDAHFTTWSAGAAVLVTALAILTIPWMRAFKITRRIAAFTIVPLAVAAMAWVVCTAAVSQLMIAFNTHIPHQDEKLAVSISFVQKLLSHNFMWHVFTLVFVVILGLGITMVPAPSTLLGRGAVFLAAFLYFVVFVLVWLVVPITNDQNKKIMGWDKIMYVYRNPKGYYFTVVFPSVAMLTLALGVFVLYGALEQKSIHKF